MHDTIRIHIYWHHVMHNEPVKITNIASHIMYTHPHMESYINLRCIPDHAKYQHGTKRDWIHDSKHKIQIRHLPRSVELVHDVMQRKNVQYIEYKCISHWRANTSMFGQYDMLVHTQLLHFFPKNLGTCPDDARHGAAARPQIKESQSRLTQMIQKKSHTLKGSEPPDMRYIPAGSWWGLQPYLRGNSSSYARVMTAGVSSFCYQIQKYSEDIFIAATQW